MAFPKDSLLGTPGWQRKVGVAFLIVAVVGIVIFAAMIWYGLARLSADDNNSIAQGAVIRLVDQFVRRDGRWPGSWAELETLPNSHESSDYPDFSSRYPWPESSKELQKRVTIDFRATIQSVLRQDPRRFEAIKVNGPSHHGEGAAMTLQENLRKYSRATTQPG